MAQGVPVLAANVGPRYFETMGIGVRQGREFQPSDRVGAPPVVIVNEAFAKQAFPEGGAVGRTIRVPSEREDPWREIVAVVADNKYGSLSEAPHPQVFLPYLQTGGRLFVQIRTTAPPQLGLAPVKTAIAALDKTLLVNVQTTADATSVEFTMRRFATAILGVMGALGLLLAMVGLFGALAWEVTRRTPEIGIRMALGASRRAVRNVVVRDSVRLVGAGRRGWTGRSGRRHAPAARIPGRRQHGRPYRAWNRRRCASGGRLSGERHSRASSQQHRSHDSASSSVGRSTMTSDRRRQKASYRKFAENAEFCSLSLRAQRTQR